ncbi:hypothetical protein GLOIN_2v1489934 [Rhizophagus clarus]|uniref:Uncharacterized protein n=1 Tax=Rhizophagus clarus TaxID=94130 RepID=A0A8H3LVQ9_9GLOM|nr:hypothetical protein GLOIN_2v1489934 [Rhizophagus clarus]
MYSSQDNISNSANESNIAEFINGNGNRLPQTTATTTTQEENVNSNDPSHNCNHNDIFVMDNNFPATHATIPPTGYNQFISHPGNNYQQPIFNDVANNNVKIPPNNVFQRSTSNNTNISPPHFDQNSPQTNTFLSLNSLGIFINSPQAYVVIMPVPVATNPADIRQQDAYSITNNLQTQFKQ